MGIRKVGCNGNGAPGGGDGGVVVLGELSDLAVLIGDGGHERAAAWAAA